MKHLGINEIKEILPHRHPFLLVDYIEDYEPGEYAVGYKCVTYREDFFAGHFPQEPVMPGVLIIEALAQVGAVAVLMQEENKGKLGYFGGIKNCRFRRKVVPGDKLKLEARIIRQKGPVVVGLGLFLVLYDLALLGSGIFPSLVWGLIHPLYPLDTFLSGVLFAGIGVLVFLYGLKKADSNADQVPYFPAKTKRSKVILHSILFPIYVVLVLFFTGDLLLFFPYVPTNAPQKFPWA